jgi:REP element-mobilizing transposase RayT
MATSIFILLTWNTWNRYPTIRESEARFLRQFLPAEAARSGAKTVALGLVADHVHLLLRVPGTFDVPRLAQQLKGKSSRLASQTIEDTGLMWARSYDAQSVSPGNLPRTIAYIRDQHLRHPDLCIPPDKG